MAAQQRLRRSPSRRGAHEEKRDLAENARGHDPIVRITPAQTSEESSANGQRKTARSVTGPFDSNEFSEVVCYHFHSTPAKAPKPSAG